jgi:C-terminal processing protease CtpA/Prc
MQSTKKLTLILRDLVALLDEEAASNPSFAARLDAVLAALPESKGKKMRSSVLKKSGQVAPDVFAVLQEKGEAEYRFWVRSVEVPVLKAIIKVNGFDPAKASQRWTDPDKFVALVADQTIARMKRGSAFLPPKSEPGLPPS